ncbi:MAG: serine hydrolase [Ruminococcus sp.]|nr:serine hydrolase [Ruminococcus sp.]
MLKISKKITALIVSLSVVMFPVTASAAEKTADRTETEYCASYVLMEASTGTAVREYKADKPVKMGSFPKLMTVLLAAEAVERGELSFDTALTASEYANSMQGAQIWLMPGEKMTLKDLLKAVIIGNANDAACVIAESIGGTEEKFAELMNSRAAELGMSGTRFTNSNGYYDEENQYTTARDAALLLRELSLKEQLSELFTTRLDELKNGGVQLVTTNTMCTSYKGSVGFKCGYGALSGYFAAEGAARDGVCYVAAVMNCREEEYALSLAKELLDTAFGGYIVTQLEVPDDMPGSIAVKQGRKQSVRLMAEPMGNAVVAKGSLDSLRAEIYLPEYVYAPLNKGDTVGELRIFLGDTPIRNYKIRAAEDIKEKNVISVLSEMLKNIVRF